MKMKMKALAAVVAMCAAGGANAAIDLGGTGLGDNTELFLSAWDPVNQVSYTRDLGIHYADFLSTAQNTSASWAGSDNTVWATQFGASNMADLRWNVAAVNNFDSTYSNINTYGYMATSNDSPALMKSTTDVNLSSIDNAILSGKNYIQYVNGSDTNAAVNATLGYGVADAGAYAGSGSWNNNFGGVVGYADDAGIGQSMAFYQVGYDSSFTTSVVTAMAGLFSLAADGTLTYTVGSVPTVPVPPALWLLGSALVGLVGVSRRKREVADEVAMA